MEDSGQVTEMKCWCTTFAAITCKEWVDKSNKLDIISDKGKDKK